jgi:hypothetical protein
LFGWWWLIFGSWLSFQVCFIERWIWLVAICNGHIVQSEWFLLRKFYFIEKEIFVNIWMMNALFWAFSLLCGKKRSKGLKFSLLSFISNCFAFFYFNFGLICYPHMNLLDLGCLCCMCFLFCLNFLVTNQWTRYFDLLID